MIGMLLTGSCNTIILKVQNQTQGAQEVGDPNYPNQKYTHPFIQSAILFTGCFICFIPYYLKVAYQKYYKKVNEDEEVMIESQTIDPNSTKLKTSINPILLLLPAVLLNASGTLMMLALTMVAASVYQMLRGMIIIATAVLSITILKRKLYRHHWSSIILIFTGLSLVGVAVLLAEPDTGHEASPTAPLGVILLIVSQIFVGFLFIVEEKFLSQYQLDPMYCAGWEGAWGLAQNLIMLPAF